MKKSILAMVVALVMVVVVAQPVLADGGSNRVNLGGDVVVEPGEIIEGDVLAGGGSAFVDGVVYGDVATLGGSIEIAGEVSGDVTAAGGDVVLKSTAIVSGNVSSLGGQVHREPGAIVLGQSNEVNAPPPAPPDPRELTRPGFAYGVGNGLAFVFSLVGGILTLIWLLIVVVIAATAFPSKVDVVERTLLEAPWASLGVGALSIAIIVALIASICLACIGFPLALVAFLVVGPFGMASLGKIVGDRALVAVNASRQSYLLTVIIGVVIVWVVGLIPVVGWLLFAVANAFAIGAVVLSRFGNIAPPFTWQHRPPGTPPYDVLPPAKSTSRHEPDKPDRAE